MAPDPITAVDINPIINDIVARRMRSSLGGLFEQPEVKLVTEEGRNFVRRSKEKYDVIISIQTMTAAAVTSGALAMSESYMFTREAFADYLDHLTPDGDHPDHSWVRSDRKLFATAREVFEERGLGNPANNLLAFEGPLAPFGHQLFNQAFLFKKSPWTAEELQDVERTSRRRASGKMVWAIASKSIIRRRDVPNLYVKGHGSNYDFWSALLAEVSDRAGSQRVLRGPPAAVRAGDRRPAIFQSNYPMGGL